MRNHGKDIVGEIHWRKQRTTYRVYIAVLVAFTVFQGWILVANDCFTSPWN